MEEKKKKVKGREYLKDFHKTTDGTYVYEGTMWKFDGDEDSFKRIGIRIFIFTILTISGSLSSGLMPIPGTLNTFYVILPYVLEFLSSLFLIYKEYRLFQNGMVVRDYNYRKGYDGLKPNIYFIFAGSILSIIAESIYALTNTYDKGYLVIIFLVTRVINILLSYFNLKEIKKLKYVVLEKE